MATITGMSFLSHKDHTKCGGHVANLNKEEIAHTISAKSDLEHFEKPPITLITAC